MLYLQQDQYQNYIMIIKKILILILLLILLSCNTNTSIINVEEKIYPIKFIVGDVYTVLATEVKNKHINLKKPLDGIFYFEYKIENNNLTFNILNKDKYDIFSSFKSSVNETLYNKILENDKKNRNLKKNELEKIINYINSIEKNRNILFYYPFNNPKTLKYDSNGIVGSGNGRANVDRINLKKNDKEIDLNNINMAGIFINPSYFSEFLELKYYLNILLGMDFLNDLEKRKNYEQLYPFELDDESKIPIIYN